MKIKEVIKQLGRRDPETEVECVVWTGDGNLVCIEMSGPATQDLIKVLAKHAPKKRGRKNA